MAKQCGAGEAYLWIVLYPLHSLLLGLAFSGRELGLDGLLLLLYDLALVLAAFVTL